MDGKGEPDIVFWIAYMRYCESFVADSENY